VGQSSGTWLQGTQLRDNGIGAAVYEIRVRSIVATTRRNAGHRTLVRVLGGFTSGAATTLAPGAEPLREGPAHEEAPKEAERPKEKEVEGPKAKEEGTREERPKEEEPEEDEQEQLEEEPPGIWTFGSVGAGNSAVSNDVFGNVFGNIGPHSGVTLAENVEVDPRSVDAAKHDYTLELDSPVLGYGPQ
jgi:hypothetical protein